MKKGEKKVSKGKIILTAAIILSIIFLISFLNLDQYQSISTNKILNLINNGEVKNISIKTGTDAVIEVITHNNKKYRAQYIDNSGSFMMDYLMNASKNKLIEDFDIVHIKPNLFYTIFINILPFAIILLIFFVLARGVQNGGNRFMNVGKMNNKFKAYQFIKTTFNDIAGVGEAIEDLKEIRDFLMFPNKFKKLGAKIPSGVLLYGPPGTGKTLLSRAIAGESKVPFFSISGSDFVEMFVGVGASRVRNLFQQAKSKAPSIIFIDELDSIGRHRSHGMQPGHDEREQTLNQLLVEMDGFDQNTGVIVIGASNRADMLDHALLRPGRFDRQICIDKPDMLGRKDILKIHAKNKKFDNDVDLTSIARQTSGFTGADLANLLNEAAILSVRNNLDVITESMLDEAIDRVVAGPQKRARLMTDEEKRLTAYHEAGHAIVAYALHETDVVQKVTILSRGRALGFTLVIPETDKFTITRGSLLDQISYLMGGRAAEELIFKNPTSGASNDIEKATSLARRIVGEYGMSINLGMVKYIRMGVAGEEEKGLYSDNTALTIDNEVKNLIRHAAKEAYSILKVNLSILHTFVKHLLERETLKRDDIEAILKDSIVVPEKRISVDFIN